MPQYSLWISGDDSQQVIELGLRKKIRKLIHALRRTRLRRQGLNANVQVNWGLGCYCNLLYRTEVNCSKITNAIRLKKYGTFYADLFLIRVEMIEKDIVCCDRCFSFFMPYNKRSH